MSRKLKYYDEFDLKEINSFFEKLIASKNDIKELTKEKLGYCKKLMKWRREI